MCQRICIRGLQRAFHQRADNALVDRAAIHHAVEEKYRAVQPGGAAGFAGNEGVVVFKERLHGSDIGCKRARKF